MERLISSGSGGISRGSSSFDHVQCIVNGISWTKASGGGAKSVDS